MSKDMIFKLVTNRMRVRETQRNKNVFTYIYEQVEIGSLGDRRLSARVCYTDSI